MVGVIYVYTYAITPLPNVTSIFENVLAYLIRLIFIIYSCLCNYTRLELYHVIKIII